MVKLVFCLRRRPDLSREDFQRYWFDVHGPLVRDRAAVLGVRRYVQVHTAPTPVNDALRASRGAPEEFDGVAELWWDSIEALVATGVTEAARTAAADLLEDERKFIDLSRSPLWLAEEREIVSLT
jgi:uncharacterized protein (TIGR02118 family)